VISATCRHLTLPQFVTFTPGQVHGYCQTQPLLSEPILIPLTTIHGSAIKLINYLSAMKIGRARRVMRIVEWLPQKGSFGLEKSASVSFDADGVAFFVLVDGKMNAVDY